jgi:hypothetical protein
LPQFGHETHQPLCSDPHLEGGLPDIHTLDEELDDPRLLGGEKARL